MGTNYYLRKKNKEKWIVPIGNASIYLSRDLCVERAKKESKVIVNLHVITQEEKELHIGKSSCGWCFDLAIYPTYNIYLLDDWKRFFFNSCFEIYDEDNRKIKPEEMMDIITKRGDPSKGFEFDKDGNPMHFCLRLNTPKIDDLRTRFPGYKFLPILNMVSWGEGPYEYNEDWDFS